MGRLTDKIAIITGAAGGMGRVAVELFSREGAKVVASDCKEQDAELTKLMESNNAIYIKADVTNEEQVQNLVKGAVEKYGKIDVLYNSHGVILGKPFLETTMSEFDYVLNIDLRSQYMLCLYAAREMAKHGSGSIISVSSGLGVIGAPASAIYCTAKGGLVNMTRALAADLAEFNIRVNSICPGVIDTPMPRKFCCDVGGEQGKDEVMKVMENLSMFKRMGKPEEIVWLAVYLASDESTFTTGSIIVVDGGTSAV